MTVHSTAVPDDAEADFRAPLLEAADGHASVMVLLTEGYDGALVRKILGQARDDNNRIANLATVFGSSTQLPHHRSSRQWTLPS